MASRQFDGLTHVGIHLQLPSRILDDLLHTDSGMTLGQMCLAVVVRSGDASTFTKPQHRFGRDHRAGSASHQPDFAPPLFSRSRRSSTISIARRRDVAHPLRQPMFGVLDHRHKAMRQARDIACPA